MATRHYHMKPGLPGWFRGRFQGRSRVCLYAFLFITIFLVLQRVYINTREQTANVMTHYLNASVASWTINRLTPDEQTTVRGSVIESGSVGVDIMKGCEGFEVFLLLVAGVLAYPAPWRRKLIGLAVGALMVYVLNLVRIISLYYIFRHARDLFEFMHVSLWQTVMILVVALFYIGWTRWATANEK